MAEKTPPHIRSSAAKERDWVHEHMRAFEKKLGFLELRLQHVEQVFHDSVAQILDRINATQTKDKKDV